MFIFIGLTSVVSMRNSSKCDFRESRFRVIMFLSVGEELVLLLEVDEYSGGVKKDGPEKGKREKFKEERIKGS